MQKFLGVLLIGVTLILSAICLLQSRQLADQKKEISVLQTAARSSTAKLEEQEVAIKQLKRQRAPINDDTQTLVQKNAELKAPAKSGKAASKSNGAGTDASAENGKEESDGGMFAKMLSDPKMKEMMRQQQKQVMKMMYGPLLKDLKLSPEESDKLNALLLDNQMSSMDKASELMKPGDKTEATKAVAKQREEMENEIKSLLGDERFAQYKDYTEVMPDRMALEQFKAQTGDNPLRDDQTKALLQIMREERKKAAMPDFSKAENFSLLGSEDAMEKLYAHLAEVNQHVLERSASLLTPEQLESLGTFQTNQLEMQKMGMSMAKSMFGRKTNSAP